MKTLYIATVQLSVSETDSFGGQKQYDRTETVPVWGSDESDAKTLIERHFAPPAKSPGNWVRITDIVLAEALGQPND